MSNPIAFASPKSVICHGAGALHLLDYRPGTKIWTGQPNVEDFDDPLECIKRYRELGGDIRATKDLWPEGKVPTESGGVLAWVNVPADSAS